MRANYAEAECNVRKFSNCKVYSYPKKMVLIYFFLFEIDISFCFTKEIYYKGNDDEKL